MCRSTWWSAVPSERCRRASPCACTRIVQESLTNVVKHAGQARASVLLDYGHAGSESFTARIVDDGRNGSVPPETGGQGLIGMRERAKLYGGTLTAGPRAPGGFEVVLTLPATSMRGWHST
ncbi:MAG: ATP-binding protein [Umezawaea sp.]